MVLYTGSGTFVVATTSSLAVDVGLCADVVWNRQRVFRQVG